MSLRLRLAVVVVGAGVLAGVSDVASAGILSSAGKDLASGAAEGAVEKLEPALARTIADVDNRLTAQEERLGNVVGGLVGQTSNELGARLGQVDGILEKRILQVQLGVDDVLDHGLDKIDGVARQRIAQIDSSLAARIKQVDGVVARTLADADHILKTRIADIDKVVTSAIDRADGALGARIEQLDEVAGRRLADVDVIATKQRLGLERTINRAAWLIALVIFVVMVVRALWNEYLKREATIAASPPGTARAWQYFTLLGKPLLRHAVVGAVVAALLAVVPGHLPMAAAKDQQALTERHYAELEQSLAQLDWTRVRFHASQLEFLEPDSTIHYQALEAKAQLLRDVLSRPTALATAAGVALILGEVRTLERMQGGRPDPDAQTVRAMILWQGGGTRKQEQAAATLAARALWSSPRGFTLAPMARILVEAYRHAPVASVDDSPELQSTDGFDAVLAVPVALPAGSPFEGADTLFHLMRQLDEATQTAFVAMIEAQVRVSGPEAAANPGVLTAAKKERNANAQLVVDAWQTFDEALRESPALANSPLVLSVFRLNDVLLSHALWFTTNEATTEWPKKFSDLNGDGDKARKLALAPARTVWARRYATLLQGPARELIELQEADRFEAMETDTLAFERAMATLGGATTEAPVTTKKAKRAVRAVASAPPADAVHRRLAAADAAAALGLYQRPANARERTPLALTLIGDLEGLEQKARDEATQVKGAVGAAGAKGKAAVDARGDELETALRAFRARLVARGPRLI
jgi:hypothetical protein